MNISFRWLRSLAPEMTDSADEVAARLAMYGAPVDEQIFIGAELDDVVIARVAAVRKHPNADRLSLCEVDAGTGELLQVVCGAPNVRGGAIYPFAPVGARLPGGIAIRKAKIRGEESRGMLCSERELGLGREHEGILELRGRYEPGSSFTEALELDDVRLVVDVTPNRPDLLSHLGIARELAPGGVAGLQLPPFPADDTAGSARAAARPVLHDAVALGRATAERSTGGVRVTIEDAQGCPRYIGAVVRGVRVGPSPEWLASRLRAVGLRPVNNVVDATNYVLHELGQPLHAFDLDRLAGNEVIVRRVRAGESIVTLDGERRALSEDMVVIADAESPVAVAGVMGGENSEVTQETRDLFVECALFDPRSVRRTRGALGLSTDASFRFERGVDPEGPERATRRVLALIVAVAGGEVEAEAVDLYPEPREAPVVVLRPQRVSHLLGTAFDASQVEACLEPIGFRVVARDRDGLRVQVPGHRWYDIEREADLIEEVARRHGYDAFPDELRAFRPSIVPDDPMARLENRLRAVLVGQGFLEARTAAFAPEAEGDVALLLPLSAEESRLRRALMPGLLHRVEYNFARGERHVRLFELGTAFGPPAASGEPPREATHLAVAFTGSRARPHWSAEQEAVDLWDLKGLLAELGRSLGSGDLVVEPGIRGLDSDDTEGRAGAGALPAGLFGAGEPLDPSQGFRLVTPEGGVVGCGGRVSPSAVDAPAWADPVWALELEVTAPLAEARAPAFSALPAHPATERDIALLVPGDIPAARIAAVVREEAGPLLEAAFPFDLYRGRGIPAGMRSIAYRLRFRAPDRTLTDREADRATARVLDTLKEELGVERRGE